MRWFVEPEHEHRRCDSAVRVQVIDGAYTSQQCSACGFVRSDNRPSQAAFRCLACGHTENTDLNAARNIAARAAVNRPTRVCSPYTRRKC